MVARELACKNRLLALLPDEVFARWWPELEDVDLPLGAVLRESGARISHAVFPLTAIVCLVYLLEDGGSTEIAVIGHEGLVGMPLFMGGGSTLSRAVVQSAGRGLRLRQRGLRVRGLRQRSRTGTRPRAGRRRRRRGWPWRPA